MRISSALFAVAVIGCLLVGPQRSLAAEEQKPEGQPASPKAEAAPAIPTSYEGTVSLGKGRAQSAVRVRFQFVADAPAKSTVQYLPTDRKQVAKYPALDMPAEATFACAPPKGDKKNEYRLAFAVPVAGGAAALYGRLEVFRETEFTKNSTVKVEITDKIARAVAEGEVQIITVKDPHLDKLAQEAAAAGAQQDPKARRGRPSQPEIPGVGPAEILKLTLGNRAFGS